MQRILGSMIAAVLMVGATMGDAKAGSRQSSDPTLPIEDVSAFADQVQKNLAERGAHVALVARVGRDPGELPAGIAYTHVGIWVYSNIEMADGRNVRGYAVNNLYQRADDLDVSDLVQDYPADFFAGAYNLDAGIIVPDRRLQAKLLDVINAPTYQRLHNPSYSVVANPDSNAFQNCTEHTLNLLMAALYDTDDMTRIKANTRAHFTPQTVEISPLKRLVGPMVMDGVAMSDQTRTVRTATFTTIADFMASFELVESAYRLTPSTSTPL
ncbi:MAG: DUF2145 domain-containing protein [Geminicoccaceae bacterium]